VLARVLGQPFLYAGDYSPHRSRKHGAPPAGLSGDRFVVCLQNHDQVGNRANADRLTRLLGGPARQRLESSLLLLAPHLPLLFMGEEYGEERPFPFFCSFNDAQLVQAVRDGRRREFEALGWEGEVPDPQSPDTFAAARLSWSWPEGTPRRGCGGCTRTRRRRGASGRPCATSCGGGRGCCRTTSRGWCWSWPAARGSA
jgi:maltooligosyltrehalose trehalohydrolase